MSRPSKAVTQAKKVAPPAVPDVFRHSGSSFGSAGYASSEDSCFLSGSGPGGTTDDGSYGMPSGKSPGPIFTHPGFAFPPVIGKYAHAEDQGARYTMMNVRYVETLGLIFITESNQKNIKITTLNILRDDTSMFLWYNLSFRLIKLTCIPINENNFAVVEYNRILDKVRLCTIYLDTTPYSFLRTLVKNFLHIFLLYVNCLCQSSFNKQI